MTDIVDRLRAKETAHKSWDMTPAPLYGQAADEIERLRGLIAAWADADDDPADIDGPYHAAWLALRKAVGR